MALDLKQIREAVIEQIRANVQRELNYYPYIPASPNYPYVGLRAAPQYLSYHETFSSSVDGALCDLGLEIVVAQNARSIDQQIVIDDLLSAGTGKTSSIVDAIEADRTLGGVVQTCICRFASGTVLNDDGSIEAVIPLQIAQRRT